MPGTRRVDHSASAPTGGLIINHVPTIAPTAYLDLGLVLARLRRPDEAAHFGVLALGTNHLVPSNAWRADELVAAVSRYRGVPEVEELRELAAERALG